MRCDQCRHWQESDEWEAIRAGFGECKGVRERWTIEDEATKGIEKYPTEEPTVEISYEEVGKRWAEAQAAAFHNEKAYVQDGSGFHAFLFTGPDFFCAKFSAADICNAGEG